MTAACTDAIATLRNAGRHELAWSNLLRCLQAAEASRAAQQQLQPVWRDHSVGRYGDSAKSSWGKGHDEPGFLLWPYFRLMWQKCVTLPTVDDQIGAVRRLADELHQSAELFLQTVARVDGYRETPQQVRSWIAGHFSVCQTILSGTELIIDPTAPIDVFQESVATVIESYYRAARSQSGATMNALRHKLRLPLPTALPAGNMETLPSRLASAWTLARNVAQTCWGTSVALDLACGMAQRATRWLVGQATATAHRPWRTLLLLEGPTTSCAWLELEEMPDDFGALRAFPDPIRLGLLGFNSAWCESFVAAMQAVSGTVHEDQPKSWCWSLHYADRQLAHLLTRTSPELAEFVQRPLEQTGSSASASLAVMLYRATRGWPWSNAVGLSAAVTEQGDLIPVRLSEKLQASPLWQKYLAERLKLLIVAPSQHREIDGWTESLAANRHLQLLKCKSVDEASRGIHQWRKRRDRRRLLQSGAAIGSMSLMAAWQYPSRQGTGAFAPKIQFDLITYHRATEEAIPLSHELLPLRPGDEVQLDVHADRSLYFYLFWINIDGTADPLWPWDRDWQKLDPERAQPCSHFSVPDAAGYWTLTPDREGVQSVVLVASEHPCELDAVQLRRLFFPIQQSSTLRPIDRDRLIRLRNHEVLRAHDLSPVAHAARHDAVDPISVLRRGAKELLTQRDVEVQAIIFPFENTPR